MATQEYYIKNKEEIIKKVTLWRHNNREKTKEYWKTFYRKNKDAIALAQINYRKEDPIKYLYNLAKRRAKKNNIPFEIEISDLVMPERCPYLGIEIDSYNPKIDNHPSLDRIDNSKGYITGNVEVISHRANRLKSDATAIELLAIGLRMLGDSA